MDSPVKNQYDSISTLWKGAWDQFNERRRFEFQVSFGVWTFLSAFTAIILTKKDQAVYIDWMVISSAFAALVALNFLYWRFIKELRSRNLLDRDIAFFYEKEMQNLCGMNFDQNITDKIKSVKDPEWVILSWSHGTQILITILLSICAFTSLWYLSFFNN